MSFQIGIAQKSSHHLPESRSHEWQEDPGDDYMVSRLSLSRSFSSAHHGQIAWNVSNGHLVTLKNYSLLHDALCKWGSFSLHALES